MTLGIMIILCVVVQLVGGNQRIVHDSEPHSDNKEFFTRISDVTTVLVIRLIMHWLLLVVDSALTCVHICIDKYKYIGYMYNYMVELHNYVYIMCSHSYILNTILS